ncbi:hypothetical protein [Microvirga aerophila]|uniref:hypothetical protein n=1 Tax=Microvirga aerophila TaxID=670291 RepID=UPI0013B420EC|nr:hypothetical protein [Microvirga aerophila]
MSACVSSGEQQARPMPPANLGSTQATPSASTAPTSASTYTRRVAYSNGRYTLPDGTTVAAEPGGGFTLSNGTVPRPDGTGGIILPNGARCVSDGNRGYLCP